MPFPISTMKKILSAACSVSMLLGSVPALAATATSCDTLEGVKKMACVRLQRQSDALKGNSAKEYREGNTSILQGIRRNRRSDVQDRYGVKKSAATQRAESKADLKSRRLTALQRRQERIAQNKVREAAVIKKRQELLQTRINTQAENPIRDNVLSRDKLRTLSKSIDAQVQKRRAGVKKAHEKCRELRGGERLECLQAAREKVRAAE
jgi:hypothetical protein